MDETFMLILLSIFMLVASYLAGSIPLVVSLSEAKLQLVTVFGAGLLVGTALAVIIPEGISSLVSSQHFPSSHAYKHADVASGSAAVMNSTDESHVEQIHSIIGVSLVIGFLIMLLIDQISARHSRSDVEGGKAGPKITATIGLVVHSAVDGVALGAAASTAHHDVELIVFLAIMLHKAPAAFGLVSFLMHEGLERKRIRKHLLVFSLAAPLLSLITYFFIGPEGKEKLSSMNMTGVAMLFSAGTFLYVAAVHVLPELTARAGGSLKTVPLVTLVIGACLPLLLTAHHHH